MKKLYRLSIYNEDGSDRHTFCQRCPKDELFNYVEVQGGYGLDPFKEISHG